MSNSRLPLGTLTGTGKTWFIFVCFLGGGGGSKVSMP